MMNHEKQDQFHCEIKSKMLHNHPLVQRTADALCLLLMNKQGEN